MTTSAAALVENVKAALGDKVVSVTEAFGEVTLVIKATDLLEIMTALRDRSELRFEQMIDLCGVDYGGYGAGDPACNFLIGNLALMAGEVACATRQSC